MKKSAEEPAFAGGNGFDAADRSYQSGAGASIGGRKSRRGSGLDDRTEPFYPTLPFFWNTFRKSSSASSSVCTDGAFGSSERSFSTGRKRIG